MFQVQAQPLRMVMIELLSEIRTEDSTVVLARRALYDLDDEVRLAAALELRSRRREHYQPTLVDGFRYPWEQVAWNAADALIALDDKDLALDVVELLDEPDPSAPYLNEAGNWAVREVASINHLRNCQLCHARSTASSDPVRGLIPPPGQPLPQVYYQSKSGNFVRADFTYIKQDFSVIQPVEKHQQWPKLQRLDYVVRERELTPLEYPLIEEPLGKSDERNVCPQHLAVIYALRTLTGKDAGARAEVWREILRGRLSLATPPERTPLERMLADRR
jgi:hypothetical protein